MVYHLSTCLKIQEEDRNVVYHQFIEIIIVLFRNILRIDNDLAMEENLKDTSPKEN